jgi:hypothetical protein
VVSIDMMSAEPASPAANPVTTRMPAPTIAPMSIEVASNRPDVRFSWVVDSLQSSTCL